MIEYIDINVLDAPKGQKISIVTIIENDLLIETDMGWFQTKKLPYKIGKNEVDCEVCGWSGLKFTEEIRFGGIDVISNKCPSCKEGKITKDVISIEVVEVECDMCKNIKKEDLFVKGEYWTTAYCEKCKGKPKYKFKIEVK